MNIKKIIIGLTLGFVTMFSFMACQPEEFTMGEIIPKDELNFIIYQDTSDPNMIILKSGNSGMTPLWITPMGRSTRVQDTVKLPFAGEYFFIYGVQSAGGFVMADTLWLTLTTNNLNYVDDPLWTLLTGGVGNEKTWLLDLDANGVSKYFVGPLFFAGLDNNWSTITEGQEPIGGDGWIWEADWPGNQWMMPAADFGSMTFSLAGGATVTVDHQIFGVTETGTYFLDVENKTLRMTDARPLHDAARTGHVVDWGDLRLLSLTENYMQLAALRDPGLSGEGAALFIYNFISQEYSENWVPPVEEEPVIELDLRGLTPEELLSVTTSTSKTWRVNTNTPFNWASLDGTFMNPWNSIGDYPGWTGYDQAAKANIENIRITFNLDGSVKFRDNQGTETEGVFVVDDDNVVSFTGVSPSFNIVGWVNASTTAENQWQIVRVGRTGDVVTDIWFGRRDPAKPEYMVYHFTLTAEGAAVDPITQARRDIIMALAGADSISFRIDDTWPVDWGTDVFGGGWTTPAIFTDYTANSWMWTAAVRASISAPRLIFKTDGFGNLTATRVQDGIRTTTIVGIDPVNMILTIDGGLLKFGAEASWMPVANRNWKIIRTNLAEVNTQGIWFATIIPNDDGTQGSIMYRYVVAN